MEKELKWIKKHYGEKMMHLCREFFPKILENEGVLSSILLSHFAQSRTLAEDIINQNIQSEFKNYIFSFVDVEKKEKVEVESNAAIKLLRKAGYILYPECKTEEDIQSFKKYWAKGEELCTFRGGRLKSCRVWFAVKENVDDIKREDFENPSRQDEYGTSVISIQFSRDIGHTLSIKNRYNHTVRNPDNTFNNDLDNIIPGLADAFESDYGVKNVDVNECPILEIEDYIYVDGKYYHFNFDMNNIYYCDNNIIIDNFEIKQLPSHQMIIDYFIIDFKTKEIKLYDNKFSDGFIESLGKIKNITKNGNIIFVERENGEVVEIGIDEKRHIVSIKDEQLTSCGDDYLVINASLKEIYLPNLKVCGNNFLYYNKNLKSISLPKLTKCGNRFLSLNNDLEEIYLPNLEKCGDFFLMWNNSIEKISLPNLIECGKSFLADARNLKELNLPKLKRHGDYFLLSNELFTLINKSSSDENIN